MIDGYRVKESIKKMAKNNPALKTMMNFYDQVEEQNIELSNALVEKDNQLKEMQEEMNDPNSHKHF